MKRMLLLMSILCVLLGCSKKKDKLYVYNWSEYLPREVIEEFEKETGISVIYSTYDSNEMMYSKLKLLKGKGYDVVFPSSYYIARLVKDDILGELDHSRLDNIKNLSTFLMNQPYDKTNKYSLPYLWGSSLIVYNTKYIPRGSIDSWKDLWKEEFKGYVLLNNDLREVFQMALISIGESPNTKDPKSIERAYLALKELLPSVRIFNSDSPKQPFISGDVRIGLTWNGEAYMAIQSNDDLDFAYPKEGAILWLDCVAITKHSENTDNAYKFINYLLRAEVAAKIVKEVGYSTPNREALMLLPDSYTKNRLTNPTSNDLKNAVFQEDVGEALMIYEKFWEKLKTNK